MEREEIFEESIDVLEFLLLHQKYGIEVGYIREVFTLREYTPLPGTPLFVVGIVNVRGQIVSIVNLLKLFALPQKGITELNKLIIIHSNQMEFGFLADRIMSIRSIPLNEIQPIFPEQPAIPAEYLSGMTEDGLFIFDMKKMLSDNRVIVYEVVEM